MFGRKRKEETPEGAIPGIRVVRQPEVIPVAPEPVQAKEWIQVIAAEAIEGGLVRYTILSNKGSLGDIGVKIEV